MANLVSTKKISIKSTKSKSRQATLQDLYELCQKEKKLCLIKNELMFVYKKFPLASKAAEYVPYTDEEYEEFAMANFITNDVLQFWLDRLLKDPSGQAFFAKHGSNLNKLTKVEDIALLLRAIFESHMRQGGPILIQSSGHPVGIDAKYKAQYMSKEDGDLFAILKEVKDWRIPGRKLLILGCFMDHDNRKANSGSLA